MTSSPVRASRRGKWRAAVLIAVHVAIAAHVAHYLANGRTLSPVEPSESMYTLELGELNAGFLFFVAALLLTAIFGRFFCGWGCHLVALQDLCGWIMKKLGVKPRPFRSRLLLWFPLGLALYMFVWPTVRRWIVDGGPAFPGFSNHLMTDGFWETFPGPVFAVLTFVTCGFVAVYLLGAKGFCTYACPYGGFFGLVDGFAPGRIVVNDDCEQCGHCTATCTSNVLVHDEVRRHGAVIDPGCMKCMDCVSVCPKGALSFGFARPARFRKAPAEAGPRIYPLSWTTEVVLALVALGATFAFRGLYDGPPLLMSVALGGITAFLALRAYETLFRPNARVQNVALRTGGTLRAAGVVWVVVSIVWLGFAAHSGYVQWHRFWGRHHLERTAAPRAEVLAGTAAGRRYSAAHERAARRSLAHFEKARRAGLVDTVEVELGVAWGYLLEGRDADAARAIRRTIEMHPENAQLHRNLFDYQAARGDLEGALATRRRQIDAGAATWDERLQYGGMLAEAGRDEDAATVFARLAAERPERLEAHYNLGGLLRRAGRIDEAVAALEEARRVAPGDFDVHVELGLSLAASGRPAEAARALRRAVELGPERIESREYLPGLAARLEAEAAGAR